MALYEAALKVRKGRGCWGNYKNSSVATSVDVRSRRLRPTSPRRLLEFTVLRRHDVGARRRWDQCMTSSRRPHDVEFLAGGPQFCSNPPVLWTPVVFTKISDFFAFQNLKKVGKFTASIERPKTKNASASLTPWPGLCPWTSLGALPQTPGRYRLTLPRSPWGHPPESVRAIRHCLVCRMFKKICLNDSTELRAAYIIAYSEFLTSMHPEKATVKFLKIYWTRFTYCNGQCSQSWRYCVWSLAEWRRTLAL